MVPLKKEKLRNLKSKNSLVEGGGSFWKLSRAKNRIFFPRNLKTEKVTNGSFWKVLECSRSFWNVLEGSRAKNRIFSEIYKSEFDWWKLLEASRSF